MKSNLDQEILNQKSLDQEIKGTSQYIENIIRDMEDRIRQGDVNSGFLYHSKHWLKDAFLKLERLVEQARVYGMDF